MEDLLELVLDIGGDVLELVLERLINKHSCGPDAGGIDDAKEKQKDPWERVLPVPPWEQTVTRLPWER